jgi:hypothetical protein
MFKEQPQTMENINVPESKIKKDEQMINTGFKDSMNKMNGIPICPYRQQWDSDNSYCFDVDGIPNTDLLLFFFNLGFMHCCDSGSCSVK